MRKSTFDPVAYDTWPTPYKGSEGLGVFGWAVALEKTDVGCELWKSCCGL